MLLAVFFELTNEPRVLSLVAGLGGGVDHDQPSNIVPMNKVKGQIGMDPSQSVI
jgi:hypothetical protein